MGVYVSERKRSTRGKQRIESLLDAACQVFGEIGYHGATTNAIAAAAGVSPATLYQFFPNKEALADGVSMRYSAQLAGIQRAKDLSTLRDLPLVDAIPKILEPVIRFHRKNPAFKVVLTAAPLSGGALEEK